MARYDLDDLQQKVHRLAEVNADYPTSGDDEYDLRTGLINDKIDDWEKEEGTLWNELWAQASFASTSATSYSLVSSVADMKFPGGFIELAPTTGASIYWDVIKPEDYQQHKDTQKAFAYFLGNPQAGFTLYFNTNLYPGAGTIKFPYYKKATRLAVSADKPEMTDPEFIVHGVVSDILAQEDPANSDLHLEIANSKLKSMKTGNLMSAPWQEARVRSRAGALYGYGFGR